MKSLKIFALHILPPQGSISPTFYKQLLHTETPKAQKDSQVILCQFALLGSGRIKTACKILMKFPRSRIVVLGLIYNSHVPKYYKSGNIAMKTKKQG